MLPKAIESLRTHTRTRIIFTALSTHPIGEIGDFTLEKFVSPRLALATDKRSSASRLVTALSKIHSEVIDSARIFRRRHAGSLAPRPGARHASRLAPRNHAVLAIPNSG
jgi:hypothetical protein